VIAPAPRGFTR